MKDDPRIERLISLAERIIVALESDIAALKDGFESWFPSYMSGEEIPLTN